VRHQAAESGPAGGAAREEAGELEGSLRPRVRGGGSRALCLGGDCARDSTQSEYARGQFDVLIVLGYPADRDGNPTAQEQRA